MSTVQSDPSVHAPVEGIQAALAAIFGPPRGPSQRQERIERRGPPVVEVALLWHDTVLEVRHLPAGAPPLVLAEGLPEIRWDEGQAVCTVPLGAEGWIEGPEGVRPLDLGQGRPVGSGEVELGLIVGEQLVIRVGDRSLFLRLTPAGARVAGRISTEVDLPFAGILSMGTFLAALVGVVVATNPPLVDQQVMEGSERLTELLLTIPPPQAPAPVATTRATRPDAGEGRRDAGEEGRVGRAEGRRTARGRPDLQRRRLDKEIAENAGVLGALADAGALGGVFDAGLSGDMMAGIGSLHGQAGVQLGTGYGALGRGPGGGGDLIGSFTGTGTHGHGDGHLGDFSGGGDLGPKGDGHLRVTGPPLIIGGLDKGLIDAVVKQHMAQIRYCYQRQLVRQPELEGKISMQFVIASDGSVSKARVKSSSLGSQEVGSCLQDRFLQLHFPAPTGGGIVLVTYPFMFSRG